MKAQYPKIIFFAIILLALLGYLTSPIALLLGFIFTFFYKAQLPFNNPKLIPTLLKISVVGLGFGMSINETLQTSKEGFTLTLISIVLTLSVGWVLARALKIESKLSYLISSGTAICGGSAIASVAPIIKAEPKTISLALGVVFLLNSIALFLFPVIGSFLEMSQAHFGLWCAIAIHDTSSVVGAAIGYGDEALKIATIVKLSRTLWIIPLSLLALLVFRSKGKKIKLPYFIVLFIIAIVLNSNQLLPLSWSELIVVLSKRLLITTLFIVGTSISIANIKETGLKPMLFAMLLWGFISIFSLIYILN